MTLDYSLTVFSSFTAGQNTTREIRKKKSASPSLWTRERPDS